MTHMTDAQYRILLAGRREQLVQRAQRQREELAYRALPLVHAWVWVERGAGVWRTLQAHPWGGAHAASCALCPSCCLSGEWSPDPQCRSCDR